jgi:hypothetical protein
MVSDEPDGRGGGRESLARSSGVSRAQARVGLHEMSGGVSAGTARAQKELGHGQSDVVEDPNDVRGCALAGPRRARGGRS